MRRAAVLLAIIALLAAPAAVLAQEEFTADLDAEQEVPAPEVPVDYEGQGSGTFVLSADESEISYEVSHENLTGDPVGAHIHYGAPGVAGDILLPLDHTTNPMTGTLTEADFMPVDGGPQTFEEALDAMRAGDTYVNVHTEANPPGEIRGQLIAVTVEEEEEDGTPPPTSMSPAEGMPAGGTTLPLMLLVLIAAAAFLFGLQRLYARRA
jgi:hypothetical protein